MTDHELLAIGAKHSTAGQFSREFTEAQWITAAREILAAEREQCAIAGGAAADAGMDGAGVADAIRNA